MKIAKLSVTPNTIDDVLANIVMTEPTKLLNAARITIKKVLLEQLKGLKKVTKNTAPQRYILVGYHKMQLLSENDPRLENCFKVFNTKAELEATFKTTTKENIWARYEFENQISPETQLRYESFFSGFLYYYDTELRNGMSDHAMFCSWKKKFNKDKKTKHDIVTVYIDPAPLRNKLIATPGTKRNTKMAGAISNSAWTPPSNGEESDPPSPKGPPPPEVAS